jgi:hypothetical protein
MMQHLLRRLQISDREIALKHMRLFKRVWPNTIFYIRTKEFFTHATYEVKIWGGKHIA